jgi:hypothetical protein
MEDDNSKRRSVRACAEVGTWYNSRAVGLSSVNALESVSNLFTGPSKQTEIFSDPARPCPCMIKLLAVKSIPKLLTRIEYGPVFYFCGDF